MSNLKEKFETWLESRVLQPISPIRAAAVIYACREEIRNEDIKDLGRKEIILEAFDELLKALYSMKCFQETGLPYSSQALKKMGKAYLRLSLRERFALDNLRQGISFMANDRMSEIHKDLSEYDRSNIRHFIEIAKRQSRNIKGSLENLDDAIKAALLNDNCPEELREQFIHVYSQLQGQLNAVGYAPSLEKITHTVSPTDGPRSAYEMLLCCMGYYKSGVFAEGYAKKYIGYMYISFTQFMGSLWSEFKDMPEEKVHGLLDSGMQAYKEVFKTHTADMARMIGLMRFFVQHHEGKVDLKTQAYREVLIEKLNENMLLDQISHFSQSMQVSDPDLAERNFRWIEQFFIEYPRPDVNEVADEIISNITKKTGLKGKRLVDEFQKARRAKPAEMEEVAVLYYPENQELRAMRQSFFKYSKLNGEDGPKISFLKFIANNYQSRLKDIGLDATAIQQMADTGKIPNKANGEPYPLTLEHINDREYGGTNQHNNLILIPREINEQKNKLKMLQLSGLPYKDQGCWIINWVPKKEPDGRYPVILQVNTPC